jgi:hypothetical protein
MHQNKFVTEFFIKNFHLLLMQGKREVQCRQFYVNSSTETVQGIAGQERTAL